MRTIEPRFTAIGDVELIKRCAAHDSAARTSFYPRIIFRRSGAGHQGTKTNDQVGITSAPPLKGFSGHWRLCIGQSVEVFSEGSWKRGKITGVIKGFRFFVVIDGREDVPVEVCGSHLRVCQDWDDGSWIPPCDSLQIEQERNLLANPKSTADVRSNTSCKRVKLRIKYGKKDLEAKFSPGTTVEVRSHNDGNQRSWHTATVVGSAGVGKFLVEYKNLKTDAETYLLREIANEEDVRPYPPEITQSHRYEVLQEVDAWYNGDWWEGVISEVLDEWKYNVYFASTNQKLVYPHWHLRLRQNWIHGKWILASEIKGGSNGTQFKPEQGGSFHTNSKLAAKAAFRNNDSHKRLKLRIKGLQQDLEANYTPGTIVEVRSDEDGYQGSWYTATVIGLAGVGNYLVEYKTLTTDDETKPLIEVTIEENIRPCPPETPQSHRYRVFQEVDAWYNDGWWEGVISDVLEDWKYAVYFASTSEKLVYQHSYLRPHQNWVHGKWVLPSQERPSDVKLKTMPPKRKYIQKKFNGKFLKGTLVEVRSDEQGYERSWYTAVVIRLKRNDRFLVEYCTLKTDDGKEFLRKETDDRNIRPCPPLVKVDDHYCLLDKVDAWCNGGWWEGLIFKVTTVGKYMVFFETTREEMEFDRVNLRKHQEWINGQWILADKDDSYGR